MIYVHKEDSDALVWNKISLIKCQNVLYCKSVFFIQRYRNDNLTTFQAIILSGGYYTQWTLIPETSQCVWHHSLSAVVRDLPTLSQQVSVDCRFAVWFQVIITGVAIIVPCWSSTTLSFTYWLLHASRKMGDNMMQYCVAFVVVINIWVLRGIKRPSPHSPHSSPL